MKKLRGLLIILSLICLLSLGACSLTGGQFKAQNPYNVTVNIKYEFVNYTKNTDGTYAINDADYLLKEDGSADIRYFLTFAERDALVKYFESVKSNADEILKQLEAGAVIVGQDNVVLSQDIQDQAKEFFEKRRTTFDNLNYNLNNFQAIYAQEKISATQESEYPTDAIKLVDVSYDTAGQISQFDIKGKIGEPILPVYESLFKNGVSVDNADKQFITNNPEYTRAYKLICEADKNTFTNYALKSDFTFAPYSEVVTAEADDRFFTGNATNEDFIIDNGTTQVVNVAPSGAVGSVATNVQSFSEQILAEDFVIFKGLYQYDLISTLTELDYASIAGTDPFDEFSLLKVKRDKQELISYDFGYVTPANVKVRGVDSGKTSFEFTAYNGDLVLLDSQYTSFKDASNYKFDVIEPGSDNLVQFNLDTLTYKRTGEINKEITVKAPQVLEGNYSFGVEVLKSNLDIELLYKVSIRDKYYGLLLNSGSNGKAVASYLDNGTIDEINNSENGIIQQGVRNGDFIVIDIAPNNGYAIDTIQSFSSNAYRDIYKNDALLGKQLTSTQLNTYKDFVDFCKADGCAETSIYRGSGMNYAIRSVTQGTKKFTRIYYSISNITPRFNVTYKTAEVQKGTLTINYSGADVDTPAKYTQTYDIGSNYSVSSPVINGYNVDIPTVSGTMDRETVEVNVKYTPKTYKLTINHEYSTGGVAKTSEEKDVVYRQAYNFAIEGLTGYTSSVANVTGTLTTPENISVTVIYTVKTYTITVNYTGVSGLTSKSVTVEHGKSYSIESPIVAGYTPSQATVSGSNVTAGATFTVTYTKNPTPTLANANFDGTTSNALNVTDANTGAYLHFTSAINTSIFYYETSIKLNNVIGTDQWPKFGLVLENTSGDQIFFCIDAINGGNGIAYGSNKWILAGYKQSGATDFNFGLEKAEMKNLNYSFGSTIKMAVLKNGTRLVLLVNDIPTLEITRYTSFANNVKIGYLGFNFNVSITNAKCTTDTVAVNNVASEKKLVHDVVVDGDISDWTAEQKANPYSCYATDNSGKGFTVYAFMGTSGIHVFYEIKHSSWVNTQADWWNNTNVEMRAGVVGGGQSNLHIFATIIPGVTQNVLATAIKSSVDSSTGLRTTTVELVISYGLAGFTGTESSVNVGFACKTAGESAPGMTEGNAGDWWCGPRHCENSLSKVLKEGGITAQ